MNKNDLHRIGEFDISLDDKNEGFISFQIGNEPKKQKLLGLIKESLLKIIKILSKKD